MKVLAALLILATAQVSGFIHDGAAEIIFPQAIQFTLNLTVPTDDLASAALTITPSGSAPILIPIDLKTEADGDNVNSHIIHLWRLSVDHPLPLFTNVSYHWTVTGKDGTISTYDDSFVFADPRVDWTQALYPQDHFNLTAPSSFNTIIDPLRQTQTLLEKNTGYTFNENLLVSPVDPGCTPDPDDPTKAIAAGKDGVVVECDPGIEAAVMAGYRVLLLPPNADPEDFMAGALTQEAYGQLWGQKPLPAWFIDGLDQFYNPALKNGLLLPVQQAARGGTLYNLAQMTTITAPVDDLWRAQSYGMVLYIADQIGFQGLFDLARVNAADFGTAYQQAMKQPLAALLPAWQQWLFSTNAANDYGITPYQPPTSTPTATFTVTNTPTATVTATLTPTLTLTPSITPPGAYIPPTVPTVTPSNTLMPPPPSVTPRAPGSLPTPTPVPSQLQQTFQQPAVQTGVATVLSLLLILLIFLFFRLGNRR